MENARSLASRFSGLLLFLLSLAVVGVLVYLTIQSANDNASDEQAASENQVATSDEQNASDNGSSAGSSDQIPSAPDNATSTPTTGGDENGDVAGANDEPLPNTGPESAVAGAIGLAVLALAGNAYLGSRRDLVAAKQR